MARRGAQSRFKVLGDLRYTSSGAVGGPDPRSGAPCSLRPRNPMCDGFVPTNAFLRARSRREGQASQKNHCCGEIAWTEQVAVVRRKSDRRAGIGAAWRQTRVWSELCAPRVRAPRRTGSIGLGRGRMVRKGPPAFLVGQPGLGVFPRTNFCYPCHPGVDVRITYVIKGLLGDLLTNQQQLRNHIFTA